MQHKLEHRLGKHLFSLFSFLTYSLIHCGASSSSITSIVLVLYYDKKNLLSDVFAIDGEGIGEEERRAKVLVRLR